MKPITAAQIREVFRDAVVRDYEAGDIIFREKSTAGSLVYLMSGRVRVTKRVRGREDLLLAMVKKGDFVGEIALLTGNRRSATVRAETRVKVLEIPRRDIQEILDKGHPFGVVLVSRLSLIMAARLGRLLDLVGTLSPGVEPVDRRSAEGVRKILNEMYAHWAV
jgi:CRP-like cAMP-binding protein